MDGARAGHGALGAMLCNAAAVQPLRVRSTAADGRCAVGQFVEI